MPKKKLKRLANPMTAPKITSATNQVEDVIAATLSIAPPSVLMKVCRLCETKDGPFLNIFDADKVTARKIEDLMPFGVAENDDLPHKICFRCSAKVEELYEFIHRCIKTQENLRSAMGKQGPLTMKSRSRVHWEQQLNKTKVSNDDICDVLIKRAMEGISLNAPSEVIVEEKPALDKKNQVDPPVVVKKENTSESEDDEDDDDDDGDNDDDDDDDKDEEDVCLKQVKLSFERNDVKTSYATRTSRSILKDKPEGLLEGLKPLTRNKKAKTYGRKVIKTSETDKAKPPEAQKPKLVSVAVVESKKESVVEKVKEVPPPEPKETTPPFNIMDHVSTIKVNKVGILFQCKLCNRNFLRKEIVMNHGCAKNNAPPKETNSVNAPTPGPPKPPTVKYIKMDKDFNNPPQSVNKTLSSLTDKSVERLVETQLPKAVEPEVKSKPHPKAGPASRVKAKPEPPKEIPKEPPPHPTSPDVPSVQSSVSFPIAPSLNTRYKLVPGPNNTFHLVEDSSKPHDEKIDEVPVAKKSVEEKALSKSKKRKANDSSSSKTLSISKNQKESPFEKSSSPEVIDLDDNESQKPEPYPVGLFQPVPHHSSVNPPSDPPVPFTTPAMKKQSYTIVQTGNPSKLLISTKPQPVEEPAKKKSKKKTEGKKATEAKEPFTVTLEDAAPAKDPGFFTFVSLDPLLQPSYVLPTDNIIQESQITTSTAAKPTVEKEKDKYPCNMCGETFSREKKLLAHIQSHYNQMDEEDEMRAGRPGPKRRTRKT